MRLSMIATFTGALCLAACGGGSDPAEAAAPTTTTTTATTTTTGSPASPTAGFSVPVHCGIDVGPRTLNGTVSSVHDGDTLTLQVRGRGAVSVRLDSIDAPELAQPWGTQARDALAARVLGRTVSVTYAKTDVYGRTVGAVFDADCHYVNRDLVAAGLAWYYRAYQCEISRATRELFLSAQAAASTDTRGLWAQDAPEAPWLYRNGKEPNVPACSSDLALWAVDAARAAGVAAGSSSSGTTNGGGSTAGSVTSAPVCHVGPRGGTYTLTASGQKNYGGC